MLGSLLTYQQRYARCIAEMDSHVLGLQLYCFESEFSDSELLNSESDDSGDCGNTLIDRGAQTVDMFKFTDPGQI